MQEYKRERENTDRHFTGVLRTAPGQSVSLADCQGLITPETAQAAGDSWAAILVWTREKAKTHSQVLREEEA